MTAPWPPLPYAAWKDSCTTLHLWSQVVGKVRLARTPWLNHSWQTPLYVTARGLGTGPIPCGDKVLDLEFDFIAQVLALRLSDGGAAEVRLEPKPVAAFYGEVMGALARIGVPVAIHGAPNELPEATPFAEDLVPRAYDGVWTRRFWRVLVQADRVMRQFRTEFVGKASPVHFFWGGFDLAVTRFSGRRAPPHPGGIPHLPDAVTREAYSHEVASVGFWPGGGGAEEVFFYAYAYPEPAGFSTAAVVPDAARYDGTLGEFLLPYEAVRTAGDPDAVLLSFFRSTYAGAADAGGWDRAALECAPGEPGRPRPIG
ncbi:MAG TPA: DUF5996 family protein [Caulobacteraceae bacterium]|jgi:hypothetical protein|nr:DUF5996 family protein [Caulobacteraceae bacterium]